MTGVHPLTFWFANILWDGLLFVIAMSVFIIVLIAMDQRESFSSNGAEGIFSFTNIKSNYLIILNFETVVMY